MDHNHNHRLSQSADTMTQQTANEETLNKLFPIPTPAPSAQAPARFPGFTLETTAALQEALKKNHVNWHIFFNYKRFHK